MKKVNVILIALVLLVGTVFSSAAVPALETKTSTSVEIEKLLENPDFRVDVDVMAYVTFLINKEGEIVVLSVDTENEMVERFIKSRLNYKTLKTSLEKGKEYKLPVRIASKE